MKNMGLEGRDRLEVLIPEPLRGQQRVREGTSQPEKILFAFFAALASSRSARLIRRERPDFPRSPAVRGLVG